MLSVEYCKAPAAQALEPTAMLPPATVHEALQVDCVINKLPVGAATEVHAPGVVDITATNPDVPSSHLHLANTLIGVVWL